MQKQDDDLREMRNEYKAVKKQLDEFDTVIDKHPVLIALLPLLVSILLLVIFAVSSTAWIGYSALAVFIVFVISLIVLGIRGSKISKINVRLDQIEHEVKLFHATSMRKDELGLWSELGQNGFDDKPKKNGWVVFITILILFAIIGSVGQAMRSNDSPVTNQPTYRPSSDLLEQQRQQQQDNLQQRSVEAQEEANRLQREKNLQDKLDSINSSGSGSSSSGSSSTNCTTSYYGGSTAYTNCY